jgi:hypothetical protein
MHMAPRAAAWVAWAAWTCNYPSSGMSCRENGPSGPFFFGALGVILGADGTRARCMVALLKESTRSPAVKWLLILFCLSVAAYFALSEYFLFHGPHAMDVATGQTFPLKHHGSLAYVTRGEDRLLGVLAVAPKRTPLQPHSLPSSGVVACWPTCMSASRS